ncbi:SPOR domain-containing protein [Crenobacter cavernae]|uniref:SPOR domain-containing protein n=1 Tax=Crenobacter cavernae TaxID=2290923 RepID=A0A345Y580_9NEIS|nr:SPOR domain-containing protein [Crenobacter cavernae]AXK39082.1 SPOR domain-containing protein [Crenobacter cavernae]
MKWFFGLVLLLNLLAALWGTLSQRAPGELHALEVNPQGVKLLPGGWKTQADATPAAGTNMPLAEALPAGVPASELPATLDGAKRVDTTASVASAAKTVEPSTPKAKPAEAPKAEKTAVCKQWGELDGAQLSRVRAGLAPLKLSGAESAREAAPASGKFWVYLPKRASSEATRALSAELKLKGFDNYPVSSDGDFQGALSLGLFAKQQGADALLAKLKAAGFSDARAERRGKAQSFTTLRFASLTPDNEAKLAALQARLLPGVPLQACR